MKKIVLSGLLIAIIIVAPAVTAQGKSKGKNRDINTKSSQNSKKNIKQSNLSTQSNDTLLLNGPSGTTGSTGITGASGPTGPISPTPSIPCDPNAQWKNHGAYVSCVAKLRQGGQKVSEAARSDVGKKSNIVPPATPTLTPSTTPIPTPVVTGLETILRFNPIQNLETLWNNFLKILGFN